MAILHLLDSAMVGHGIVSFAGFLTICRVLVSRPHLNPHVRLFLLQVPHSLQWPTSHPSNREKTNTDNNLVYISPSLQNLYSSISLLLHFQIPKIKLYSPQDLYTPFGKFWHYGVTSSSKKLPLKKFKNYYFLFVLVPFLMRCQLVHSKDIEYIYYLQKVQQLKPTVKYTVFIPWRGDKILQVNSPCPHWISQVC